MIAIIFVRVKSWLSRSALRKRYTVAWRDYHEAILRGDRRRQHAAALALRTANTDLMRAGL